MPDLVLDSLSKRFAGVDGLSLTVRDGEFVSLLGPSGCGKGITLQMTAGFLDPTGGAIQLAGRDIGRVRACDRGLSVVFQSYGLFPSGWSLAARSARPRSRTSSGRWWTPSSEARRRAQSTGSIASSNPSGPG